MSNQPSVTHPNPRLTHSQTQAPAQPPADLPQASWARLDDPLPPRAAPAGGAPAGVIAPRLLLTACVVYVVHRAWRSSLHVHLCWSHASTQLAAHAAAVDAMQLPPLSAAVLAPALQEALERHNTLRCGAAARPCRRSAPCVSHWRAPAAAAPCTHMRCRSCMRTPRRVLCTPSDHLKVSQPPMHPPSCKPNPQGASRGAAPCVG